MPYRLPTDSDANARVSAYVRGVLAEHNLPADGVSGDLGYNRVFLHRRLRSQRHWTAADLDQLATYLSDRCALPRHKFLFGVARALIGPEEL